MEKESDTNRLIQGFGTMVTTSSGGPRVGDENDLSQSKPKALDYSQLKVSYGYLISLAVCMGLSSSNFGFAVAAGGQALVGLKH